MPKRFSAEFESTPLSFREIMTDRDPVFCIPEYQRMYAWDTEAIERLMSDCLHGFSKLSQASGDTSINTFLGTTILVAGRRGLFKVIDGQQRLISLLLISCNLIQELSKQAKHLEKQAKSLKGANPADNEAIEAVEWLQESISRLREMLSPCIKGNSPAYQARASSDFWPRIIREAVDNHHIASSTSEPNYASTIARFLHDFSLDSPRMPKSESAAIDEGRTIDEIKIIEKNYRCARKIVSELSDLGTYEKLDCRMLEDSDLSAPEALSLMMEDPRDSEEKAIIERLKDNAENAAQMRLILFGYYLMFHVGLNCVVAEDEDYAFDIFDALNTTGEPLTAIETLKPLVVTYENSPDSVSGNYKGSEAERHFRDITTYLLNPNAKKRQKETAELTTSLAMYLNGEKLSKHLKDQRSYLRDAYRAIQRDCKEMTPESIESEGILAPESFVAIVSDFAKCREIYWDQVNENDIPEDARFAMQFIRATNTSLTMPIISRYWIDDKSDSDSISEVIKMLAAFLSLRRGFTGNTANIDLDFRNLMDLHDPMEIPHPKGADPLSLVSPKRLSEKFTYNNIWSPKDLKRSLFSMLEDVIDKKGLEACREKWISEASEIAIYEASRPIARFLLLAAMHRTKPAGAGMLTRKDVRIGDENDHWNIKRWKDDFMTIEHAAPQSNPEESDWDPELYKSNNELRDLPGHTLGNLILLPKDENRTAANYDWKKKKPLYQAFAAMDLQELQGLDIPQEVIDKLRGRRRLSWLEFVDDIQEWDKAFIEERSRNLAGLAWDTIIEWLKPSEDDS